MITATLGVPTISAQQSSGATQTTRSPGLQPGRFTPASSSRPVVTNQQNGRIQSTGSPGSVRRTSLISSERDPLRWRRRGGQSDLRPATSTQSQAAGESTMPESTMPGSDVALSSGSQQRPVQLSPIDDPFGDRAAAARRQQAESVPPVSQVGSQSVLRGGTAQEDLNWGDGSRDSSGSYYAGHGSSGGFQDQDQDPLMQQRQPPPNRHDCAALKERIRNIPVTQISLDITPRFLSDAKTADDERNAQAALIANLQDETWLDRNNVELAYGRFIGFENGRVVVEDETGAVLRIMFGTLSDANREYVTKLWEIPPECSTSDDPYPGREFIASTVTWKASALCHKPLFFEDVQLERYGHSAGPILQPVKSTAHFFLNIAVVPYKAGMYPPSECQYALGYYRPGDCAPWLINPLPISRRGAILQTGAVLGLVYAIP